MGTMLTKYETDRLNKKISTNRNTLLRAFLLICAGNLVAGIISYSVSMDVKLNLILFGVYFLIGCILWFLIPKITKL